MAPCRDHTSKALRYGTRCQGLTYLNIPRTSANGMNHTCLCLPSQSWYSFIDPGGWKAELAVDELAYLCKKLIKRVKR